MDYWVISASPLLGGALIWPRIIDIIGSHRLKRSPESVTSEKNRKKQHLQFPISTTWISCEYHHIWWWRLPMFYIVLWCLVVFDDGDQQGLERSRAFIICKRCYPSWQFLAKGKLGQLKRDKSPNPKIQSARAKTSSLLGVCPYYYVLITWNCGKLLHYYYNWG